MKFEVGFLDGFTSETHGVFWGMCLGV